MRGPLSNKTRWVALSIAGLVALFGALEVVGHWTGLDLNFEDRLVPEVGKLHGVPLARMSPLTGALFFFGAMAPIMLLAGSFLEHKRRLLEDISGMAGSLVLFGGATVLLAYLYGTPLMYEGKTIPMAATTAIGFLLLGLAFLCAADEGTIPRR